MHKRLCYDGGMKIEKWVEMVRACPQAEYDEHYWSLRDRKPHDRVGRVHVLGPRRGGMMACVDVSALNDLNAHCIRSMAQESTPRRLVGMILLAKEALRLCP